MAMDRLPDDAVFVAEAGNEIKVVPDGGMIYQPSRERVHYLNPTALVVYELSIAGRTIKEIESFVGDAYGLAEPPAEAVRNCLELLLKEGLIISWPPSASAR